MLLHRAAQVLGGARPVGVVAALRRSPPVVATQRRRLSETVIAGSQGSTVKYVPPTRRDEEAEGTVRAAPPPVASLRLVDDRLGPTMSEAVRRVFAISNASKAQQTLYRERAVAHEFRLHDADVGSTRVQVARMTMRIDALKDHFLTHRKDHHNRRGFNMLIAKRQALLKYLRRENPQDYAYTISALGLKAIRDTTGKRSGLSFKKTVHKTKKGKSKKAKGRSTFEIAAEANAATAASDADADAKAPALPPSTSRPAKAYGVPIDSL